MVCLRFSHLCKKSYNSQVCRDVELQKINSILGNTKKGLNSRNVIPTLASVSYKWYRIYKEQQLSPWL